MTSKDFSIIAVARGLVTRKVTDSKSKKVSYVNDYEVSVTSKFVSPLSINALRRLGRAVHLAESYLITIQKDKTISRFECKVTAKTITFKHANKPLKKSRTKTLHTTRKPQLDVGVDLQELITYLLSSDVLDYSVSRKRVVKKAKDSKHAELQEIKRKAQDAVNQARIAEKAYLASLANAK